MAYFPLLILSGWDDFTVDERKISLQAQMETLITHDMLHLKKHPEQREIRDFPLRYMMKKRPQEIDEWWDVQHCIDMGGGDCKDFSAWMVASLRLASTADCYPWITSHIYEDPDNAGPPVTLYHVRVRVHDQILDPSAWFGMPSTVSYSELRA